MSFHSVRTTCSIATATWRYPISDPNNLFDAVQVMASGNPGEKRLAACPKCGAAFQPGANYCWLCGARHTQASEVPIDAELVKEEVGTKELDPWLVHGSAWAVFILALVVGYGLIRSSDPFLATMYVVVVAPAVLLTLIGSVVRRASGSPWNLATKILVLVGVGGAAAAVGVVGMAVLVLAAFVALVTSCFGGVGPR